MICAKYGDTVKIHYTGKCEDGTVFETSRDNEPLKFTIGKGHIISGLEEAIIGMRPGESKTIKVPSIRAHGPYNEDLIVVVERSEFPPNLRPKIGQKLDICQDDGNTILVTVTDVSADEVTLDINHPLAGKDLMFDLQLVEITDAFIRN